MRMEIVWWLRKKQLTFLCKTTKDSFSFLWSVSAQCRFLYHSFCGPISITCGLSSRHKMDRQSSFQIQLAACAKKRDLSELGTLPTLIKSAHRTAGQIFYPDKKGSGTAAGKRLHKKQYPLPSFISRRAEREWDHYAMKKLLFTTDADNALLFSYLRQTAWSEKVILISCGLYFYKALNEKAKNNKKA